jgi:hypothetical protein
MRTTINIADDIFFAAKDFAKRDQKSLGDVLSDWARTALTAMSQRNTAATSNKKSTTTQADRIYQNLGFRPFEDGRTVVTNQQVNALREQEGI